MLTMKRTVQQNFKVNEAFADRAFFHIYAASVQKISCSLMIFHSVSCSAETGVAVLLILSFLFIVTFSSVDFMVHTVVKTILLSFPLLL